jgi:ornithine carbamoyltransferase
VLYYQPLSNHLAEDDVKHFLSLADLTPDQLAGLLNLALHLKAEWKSGGNPPLLQNKTLGMVFTKPSLRTRVSFDMAMIHLGGQALYISPNEVSLGQRESVADVARVLSRYVDIIMARVFGHRDVVELAQYSRVPVINGLSDYTHPCQGLADLLTIREKFGSLQGIKLAYVGDGNNVANSLIFGAALSGMTFAIASPPGFEISGDVVAKARSLAAKTDASLYFSHDPTEAVREADVIYTDVWTSMGQENESQKRLEVFAPRYQISTTLVSKAKRHAIVMHCLPAHRGQEITDDVADGSHSALWDQAENRMHAQKAILVELMAPDYARSVHAAKPKAAPARPAASAALRTRPTTVKAIKPKQSPAKKKSGKR